MLLILHQFAHALGLKEYFLKCYYEKRMPLQSYYQAQEKQCTKMRKLKVNKYLLLHVKLNKITII